MKTTISIRNQKTGHQVRFFSAGSYIMVGWLALANFFFMPHLTADPLSGIVKIDTRLYSNNSVADANVVVFDVAYSNAVDGDDATKMSNAGENIAIQRGSSILVVEGRQPAVVNDVIPFKIWNLRQQSYRLDVVATGLVTPGLVAVVEDAYLNTSTAINPNGTVSINFTVNSSAASYAANRFRIIFKQAAALPVTFLGISANRAGRVVNVNWKVADEINIVSYEVQRSLDGSHFNTAGTVNATGNSSIELAYSLQDASAATTLLYYRIKTLELNGSSKYSSIVKVSAAGDEKGLALVSNPVENGIVNLQLKNQPAGRYTVRLINSNGQCCFTSTANHTGGNSNVLLNLPGSMATGVYRLMMVDPLNTITSQTLVISR